MSPTLRVAAQALKMKAEGVDIVDFSVGEPDFATPDHIKAAGKKAIDENFTKYTANDGIPELRRAICERVFVGTGVRYSENEVIVSSGAKASLYALSVAVFDEGDEVIIPAPYWVTYPDQVRLAGATPVFVPTREEEGFRLTAPALRQAVTPRTKAVILCHPSNPTGTTYERKDLEALVEVCLERKILIVSDEIYERLVYDGFRNTHVASLAPEVRAITVTVNGVSKAYSMTGLRLGWALWPKEIIAAMSKVQSHATSNASSVSQKAALAALTGPEDDLEQMVREFEHRRNMMVSGLRAIEGLSCYEPKGAFYAFPCVRSFFGQSHEGGIIRDACELATYLLEKAHVAVVPGDAFGAPDYVRLSFATSRERIEAGLGRMKQALAELR